MSIHGVCFDNGMSGKCNTDCEQYLEGNCDAADEFDLSDGTVEEKYEHYELYNK